MITKPKGTYDLMGIDAKIYAYISHEIEDMMTEALQAILGGADVQETLDQYQTQIESAVAN